MEWCIEHAWNDGYGTRSKLYPHSYEKFVAAIIDLETLPYGSLTTRVVDKRWPILSWFYDPSLWVMVVDCDSTDAMLGAKWMVTHEKIGHTLIQSSPGHYWIITDFIDTFSKVISKMASIPGHDVGYSEFVRNHSKICVRAMALPGKVPTFYGPDSLTDPRSIALYHTLEQHYQHPAVKKRLVGEMVLKNIKDKTMMEMAQDPNFAL